MLTSASYQSSSFQRTGRECCGSPLPPAAHHPDVGMTLNNLALVYFTDGQLEAAVEAYQNCLKTLDDVWATAYLLLPSLS